MAKSHGHSTWIEYDYQHKNYQAAVFTGFDISMLPPMCIMINALVNSIDLSCFSQYYKANEVVGGRPHLDHKILLKIYMYSLYHDIRIRNIEQTCSLGSEVHCLSLDANHFPKKSALSSFLNVLGKHIDDIFCSSVGYIANEIEFDISILYGDGTVFEAATGRHEIITETNAAKAKKSWSNVLNSPDSGREQRELAQEKLQLNVERAAKLNELGRNSYGRTDEDCVILKDKNGSFIAGYNVQFFEENKHCFVVYAYISNKNPDSAAFLSMIND